MGLYKTIIAETMRGKSIARTLFNYELTFYRVNGKILDLGSGEVRPSYYRFLNIADDSEIVTVNLSTELKPNFLADLERPFPLKPETFDFVLAFNLIEHVYGYRNLLGECHRVLNDGGKLYGVVPFLISEHADPCDFFRYTSDCLMRLLREAGFENIEVKSLGFGPFVAAYSLIESFAPRVIRPLLIFICISIDRVILRYGSGYKRSLAYLFIASKR